MKIYFSHGKESGPWGTKIQRLASIAEKSGWQVFSVDYRGIKNPDARVQMLLDAQPKGHPLVLVGSSMGAYVSAVAAQILRPTGLFLLAPAFFLPNYTVQKFQLDVAEVEIVHGWDDDIVPMDNVVRFAQKQRATLHLLNDGHRLLKVLPKIEMLFTSFLARIEADFLYTE